MHLKKARQILKSFSDDTRLRIVNLLRTKEISVTDICRILHKNQSNISKHLSRLRLTGIVTDRREGLNVYYYLIEPSDLFHKKILDSIISGLAEIDTFKEDLKKLKDYKQ